MAVVDETKTGGRQPRYCPECGHPVTVEHYCPECGHVLDIATNTFEVAGDQTRVLPPRPPASRPPDGGSGGERPRRRALLIALPMVLVIAAAAAAAIILLSSANSTQSSSQSYRQKLTSALAPVMAANRSLSAGLQSLDGSRKTISAAQSATAQTQLAVVSAQGAIAVLTVPSSNTTLSQQVQQALTEESGYLQAASSTLANPGSQSASQLQTLVTATQSALVPLAPVAAGAASSLNGTGNLLSWAAGATAKAQRRAKAAQRAHTQQQTSSGTNTSPAQTPSSPSGLSACDQNISVNSNTSCQFADNVFAQYAQDVQQAGAPGSDVVYASSPVTGQSYTETCNYNPANQIVLCSHGSDLIQFPYWAAGVYRR